MSLFPDVIPAVWNSFNISSFKVLESTFILLTLLIWNRGVLINLKSTITKIDFKKLHQQKTTAMS